MSDQTLDVLIEGYDPQKASEIEIEEVEKDWREIFSSRQNSTILQAEVIGMEAKVYSTDENTKKTCAVINVGEVRGLIPLDYAGVENVDDLRRLIGTSIAFKVIAIDRDHNIFVGSRAAALEQMANITLKKIKEGDATIAVIRSVFRSHLLVDIGGIQCEIPVNEVDYGWIDDLRTEYHPGDHIKVKVMSVDKENKKVEVSAKALKPSYWSQVPERFSVHSEYVGKVSGVSEYGIFINLVPGVDALTPHLRHETVTKGQKVLVRVLNIDVKEQKIRAKIVRILR